MPRSHPPISSSLALDLLLALAGVAWFLVLAVYGVATLKRREWWGRLWRGA